jgi:hypothetical protein
MDPIEHGALKVLLQHRAEGARKAWVHGDREIESDDLPCSISSASRLYRQLCWTAA